ncbi:MAG: bifunctional phosphopantothenoylcysteine decarboxylase/phosphopantothenate--cysteine ligase CoaBC [Candidatus Margulisbacteria bacterium]|nr:bifunctional phosphopantothenoylcysteine decarboxylase/phosphopantothenate--cysteine ligase CoaBC [Candidatus Margulisiibacteriota bacterium]
MLKAKTIILGISSSIAAYKSCEVVSQLKKLGADVWVVMTSDATKLVSPLTFRTLSGNPVITDLYSPELSSMPVPHISLAKRASLILIAPCTANVIGKLANGIADDPLSTIVISSTAKKVIAPAMNCEMWRNPLVLQNVKKLKALNFDFIGPVEGKLACGDDDIGRMAEPAEIVGEVVSSLVVQQDLKGKRFLVTAGGTREAIDPVRYISNRSSGKMGYALAQAARERGSAVNLISAPTNLAAPLDIKPIKVESAGSMLEAVLDYYNSADAVIMAAAVADYRPVKAEGKKLKKKVISKQYAVSSIELEETDDILKTIAKQKGRKDRALVGFALETDDLIANAKKKLKEKDLDLIIANDPSTFDGNLIKFSIIDSQGKVKNYPKQPKDQAAHVILDRVSNLI